MISNIFAILLGSGVLYLLTYVMNDAKDIPHIIIDNIKTVRNVSDKFLSVALDSHLIRSGIICQIKSEDFIQRSLPLAPAYLRIGGTDADRLIFSEDNSRANFNCLFPKNDELDYEQEKDNFTMSKLVWLEINEYCKRVGFNLIFDLNVLLRKDGSWDATNAKALFNFSNAHNFKVVWQLGNEPNSFKHVFGTPIEPLQLAQDFENLRILLEKYPEYQIPFIIGPDVTRPKNLGEDGLQFLQQFLCSKGNSAVDAVTWHQYYLNGKSATMSDFINPETLNMLEKQIYAVQEVVEECAPSTPIWLSETSSAYGGGAPGLSDAYIAGFLWLDKLGMAALLGINVVIRQSLYHGHYSLLDDHTLKPLPDWWISLLYKKLVGQTVLKVEPFMDRQGFLRLYAHCASKEETLLRKSAITLFGINLKNETSYINILQSQDSKAQAYISAYVLTSSNLLSKSIELNGKSLHLLPHGALPQMKPREQLISQPISLPPCQGKE